MIGISETNCTPPAIDDFPPDLFTRQQRQGGAVIFHIAVSLYLFLALAVVCDRYFVPAVEKICQGNGHRHFFLSHSIRCLIRFYFHFFFLSFSSSSLRLALNMSSDICGATFMAGATSSPELFVNVIGTFITEGDIGIGTIVGSAVFNILAVAACCGIGAGMVMNVPTFSMTFS